MGVRGLDPYTLIQVNNVTNWFYVAREYLFLGSVIALTIAFYQGRADWGMAIKNVADAASLGFIPVQDEEYDFVIPLTRMERPAVQCFSELLAKAETQLAGAGASEPDFAGWEIRKFRKLRFHHESLPRNRR